MEIRQLHDENSATFSYLLWDRASREAVLIDPVHEQARRDIHLVWNLGLKLRYTLETHVHTDHVTGSGHLRQVFNSIVVVHENSRAKCADVLVRDGDFIPLGSDRLTILHTPGHTNSDISCVIPGAVFTGDTLLVGSCGRTDYQSGDAGRLYDSITQRLFTLPDETVVYPGHGMATSPSSTIGRERASNGRIGNNRSREEFVAFMQGLKLDPPERIHEALPSNLRCGSSPATALDRPSAG
jgi:glyoxylase-like metal-dependent hydrolase (beta-lactamase superfamily II)